MTRRIEAIYPLSPSQQGMLVESLCSPRPGIHVEQAVFVLRPALDPAKFARAWREVVQRHAILRTAFVWQGRAEPLQVVASEVELPLAVHDWRARDPETLEAELDALLRADRERGFALDRAPLLRLALVRTTDEDHRFVLTFHHVLMDGWSLAQILAESLAAYDGAPLDPPGEGYRAFVAWQRARDPSEAEAWWRGQLRGFAPPDAWGARGEEGSSVDPDEGGTGEVGIRLPGPLAEALHARARQHRVTLGTLFQGVWGLLLGRYAGARDVVFGTTVSGRPPSLPGVLSMVGLFINTVPMRVAVDEDQALWPWLRSLQMQSAARSAFAYCASGQIHRWSEVAPTRPLYETVLVFENYPEDTSGLARSSLQIDLLESRAIGARTGYPLTLLVGVRDGLSIKAVHHRDRIDAAGAETLLLHFRTLLEQVVSEPEPRLSLAGIVAPDTFPRVRPAPTAAGARLYRAPRDTVELGLVSLWEEVLGRGEIGVHDSFFALGGHSLLALELVGRIEQRFGVSLPLSALLADPTVEGVAVAMRAHADPSAWSPLVPIVGGGDRPALFCVPGAAMDVVSLHPLGRALGGALPLYGLQPRGLDGLCAPHRTVEEIAACNVAALRVVQPEGPYALGGHSFGAHVAWEMAQQLGDAGCAVTRLVVFDAEARGGAFAAAAAVRTRTERLERMVSMVGRFFGRPVALPTDVPDADLIRAVARSLTEAGILPAGLGAGRLESYLRVGEATGIAFEAHRARARHPVPILLLRARDRNDADDRLGADLDETLGWRALAGDDVTVRWVSGDHVTLLTPPHVEAVAEIVRGALRGHAVAA